MSFRHKETYFETWAQAVTMAIIPKFSAVMSMLGSGCILREVYADHQRSRGGVIKRILVGMSLSDLCMSGAWTLTSWPSPKDTPIAFAIGNTQTCVAQAVFLQFGNCAAPIYNATLAIAYLLKVKYSMHENVLEKYEMWFHIPPLGIAFATTIASIPMTLFNNNLYVCWIAEYPLGCNQSYNHPPEEQNCIRGDNATIYSYAFLNFWIWSAYLVIIVSMSMMYFHVRSVERRSTRFMFSRASGVNTDAAAAAAVREEDKRLDGEVSAANPTERVGGPAKRRISARLSSMAANASASSAQAATLRRTKAMSSQAGWYIGAFFITMMPDTISIALLASIGYYNFWLHLFAYIFNPMQGYFNFLVFARSRMVMYGRTSRWLRKLSFCHCIPCCNPEVIKRRTRESMASSSAPASRFKSGAAPGTPQREQTQSTESLPPRRRSLGLHGGSRSQAGSGNNGAKTGFFGGFGRNRGRRRSSSSFSVPGFSSNLDDEDDEDDVAEPSSLNQTSLNNVPASEEKYRLPQTTSIIDQVIHEAEMENNEEAEDEAPEVEDAQPDDVSESELYGTQDDTEQLNNEERLENGESLTDAEVLSIESVKVIVDESDVDILGDQTTEQPLPDTESQASLEPGLEPAATTAVNEEAGHSPQSLIDDKKV